MKFIIRLWKKFFCPFNKMFFLSNNKRVRFTTVDGDIWVMEVWFIENQMDYFFDFCKRIYAISENWAWNCFVLRFWPKRASCTNNIVLVKKQVCIIRKLKASSFLLGSYFSCIFICSFLTLIIYAGWQVLFDQFKQDLVPSFPVTWP